VGPQSPTETTETLTQLTVESCDFTLETEDNRRLADVCGQFNENLRRLEQVLGVEINNRGKQFRVIGDPATARKATEVLQRIYAESARGPVNLERLGILIDESVGPQASVLRAKRAQASGDSVDGLLQTRRGAVRVRTESQRRYVECIQSHDISFGVGPAGTGKTYLAVACAVQALERETVRRVVLVRPAVEAGERLGFLPGDLAQKIDPYLRPLYDALYEMLGFERVAKLIERNVIEVAPLAYMRGRTLNDAFVILDEAQNTTVEQMKMFLTRIGFGSVAVVTGDVTQVDLPRGKRSGLRHAIEVLRDVEGLGFTFFSAADVVRHPLVQCIVKAYAEHEATVVSTPATGETTP
jgi:phosphate starvation-inducible PhoH-like protein